MKTKFFLTLAVTLAAFTFSYAQKTTFGIRGGVNFQNLNGENSGGDDVDGKIKTGFNAGFNAEIPVGIDFYIQPGVLFSTKGAKANDSDDKINISYVEVPVNFLYKPELGAGKLLLGFGPYVAFAAGASYKPESGDDIDYKFKNKVSLADIDDAPYMKRVDAGGNLLVGYEFANKLSFQLNAQLGMININPKIEGIDEGDQGKLKNTGFGVSLGYRF